MAYFSIPHLSARAYRFEYHSHFNGILPVKGESALREAFDIVAADQPLSLVGLYGLDDGRLAPGWQRRGTVSLLLKALQLMEERNPLQAVEQQPRDRQAYQRGECVGENIYIAAIWLADRLKLSSCFDLPATDPALYAGVRARLEQLHLAWCERGAPKDAGDDIEAMLPMLEHFNAKFYSASKYTPFDDAYFARSFALKKLAVEQKDSDPVRRLIYMTLMYLQREGVTNAQLALGPDEAKLHDACVETYNAARDTHYKLLLHSSHVYSSDEKFLADLDKLKICLADPALRNVVGFDLLGAENKVGAYLTYFEFLSRNLAELTARFGEDASPPSDPPKLALKFGNHIHCGEGMGVAMDNRAAIGYAMTYLGAPLSPSFYPAFWRYVRTCIHAARSREAEHWRGTEGTPDAQRPPGEYVSGLFDELFRNDSLTIDGLMLRRYDGNSARTRQLVAYTGKRNMMAISEAFDTVPNKPASPGQQGENYYQILAQGDRPMVFRLGHAYYYRSYVGARYPYVAFDTNLGSNAITGASGLFDSSESYRLNRGLRHLQGYIDTNAIQELSDRVMYAGVRSLDRRDVQALLDLSRTSSDGGDFMGRVGEALPTLLGKAMAPIYGARAANEWSDCFGVLLEAMIGLSSSRAVWFDAATRVLSLFANWRSYLLGCDGQGVEHTDSRFEYLRCVLLMAYSLMPLAPAAGEQAPADPGMEAVKIPGADQVAVQLQTLIDTVSGAYWSVTVGPPSPLAAPPMTLQVAVNGYKAPDSVVTVFASATASSA